MYQCVIVAIHSKTSEYISVPEFPPLRGNPMYIEYFVVYLFPSFPFSLLVLSFSFFFFIMCMPCDLICCATFSGEKIYITRVF